MLISLGQALSRYPTSFGCWDCLLLEMTKGTVEIAIVGRHFNRIHKELLREFIPNKVIMASSVENEQFALLSGKAVTEIPQIYVCKDFSCRKPVNSVAEILSYLSGLKDLTNFMLIQ